MTQVVPLAKALDEKLFGSKAVGLGQALREGVPVPPGIALSGAIVEAVAAGEERAIRAVDRQARPLGGPLAVRSSAADEDGAQASFAGQHLTLLNVPSADELVAALKEIWWSANSDSAITYRQRVGLFTRPSVGVVVQRLLNPDAAGVMFTLNPVTGDDERVIEASWGLGEAVVAGLVIPDHFRLDRSGQDPRADAGSEADHDPRRAERRHGPGDRSGPPHRAALSRRRPTRAARPARRPMRPGLRALRATSNGRSRAERSTCFSAARSPRE